MESIENKTVTFGDFELDEGRRLLFQRGIMVNLNPKAFDLLLVLIQNRGEILSKEELLNQVWENQFVEENNLSVQISALRKIFGERKGEHQFIATIPGKGYKFVHDLNDSNGEIVIENHSFSRIVIEEEVEERRGDAEMQRRGERKFLLSSSSSPSLFFSLVFFMLAVGGVWWWQKNRAAENAFITAPIKQLTTNGKVNIAALAPDGKVFAYVTNDLGARTLWLGRVEGGNHLQLQLPSEAVYSDLAFSPDGDALYFSFRDDKNPKSALYKMPVSGGAMQKVLDDVSNFKLSPDGGRITFARRTEAGDADVIFITDLNSAERREIARFPKSSAVFGSLSWSPDGKRLALSVNGEGKLYQPHELLLIETASGAIERVKGDDWRDINGTVWLADGSGLIVTAISEKSHSSVPQYRVRHVSLPDGASREITNDRSSYGASLGLSADGKTLLSVEHRQLNNIWIAPVEDFSRARQITFSSFGKYDGLWGMDFAPDGKLIYTTSDTQSQYIAAMNADGSDSKPLTASGTIDSQLTVSNDGRYIVFLSNRTGNFNVWRMDIDGANPTQLTFEGNAFQSFVSADSRHVYYKSWENQTGEMRRVSIDGGAPEILTDKETSWGGASPDGKYIAASYSPDGKHRLTVFDAAMHQIIKQFDVPKTATTSMGLRWTPDSRAIVYRDWSYGYWKHPIDGGEPQQFAGLPQEKFYNFAFSKDGKQFAFVRGQEIRDVVIISSNK
jgi:Tol biopolymer transport system component/DNA-binding winged helix-turn-helix (wHTH) protein